MAYVLYARMFRSEMTLDSRQRISTAFVSVLVVGALGGTFVADSRIAVGILTFVLFLLGICWAMAPREVFVGAGELRVYRRAWPPLRIPLASVVSASSLDRLGAGVVRVMGVGGFFGSYGLFASRTLGRFRLYSTRSGQAVLVTLKGDALPLVLTPDDVVGTVGSIGHPVTPAPAIAQRPR
jgi:hypothetical protein